MSDRDWALAKARFDSLVENPPSRWNEKEIGKYHEILSAIENASGEDLSLFRIPASEMNPIVVSRTRAGLSRPGVVRMSTDKYCNERFARQQMDGIIKYFHNLENAKKATPKSSPHNTPLTDGNLHIPPAPTPVDIFFSYAHEDEAMMNDVRRQFAIFERQGLITKWYDRLIGAGTEWKGRIDTRLATANIILLFVSPHFFDSDYCYEAEMREALRRHAHKEATVVPIILRACAWQNSPLGALQALPTDGKPFSSWLDKDEASLEIAGSIMKLVQQLQDAKGTPRKEQQHL